MTRTIDTNLIGEVAGILRDHMGDDSDQQAFLDTLDGETDVLDLIDRLLIQERDAAAMVAAIREQEKELAARRFRMEGRQKAAKSALFAILGATGERKIERPLATISRRSGSLGVNITDADAVPTQLCKVVKTPDKAAIKAQIEAGEHVPGAELKRGPDSISVRTK